MRAYHDSRNAMYRAPYGAVVPGETVILRLDVWDAPDVQVLLRTWVDGVGETFYEMNVVDTEGPVRNDDVPTRYQTAITPDAIGVVWYQFLIHIHNGPTMRYGAQDGRFGGIGQLRDWEPPSFQLVVNAGDAEDQIVREIFNGTNLMMRPPTEMTVGFLRNETTARELAESIETLREVCPDRAFQRAFDLLGSYSQAQLFALLAGASASEAASAANPVNYHHDPGKAGMAKGRLWATCLIQMLIPRKPIASSDDRIGPTGAIAREASVIEGHEDADCEAIVQNVVDMHRTLPVFAQEQLTCFAVNDDVFGFWRIGEDERAVCVLINASLRNAYDVPVPLVGEAVSDVLGGNRVPVAEAADAGELQSAFPPSGKYAMVHLYQLGTAVLYFHPEQQLEAPMEPGLGVLAHITSLPTDEGDDDVADAAEDGPVVADANAGIADVDAADPVDDASNADANADTADTDADAADVDDADDAIIIPENPGTLGAPARAFVDWLAHAGVRYWQVLPANPTDEYGSPYAGISAFAGNLRLLDRDTDMEVAAYSSDYLEFCWREANWLEPYAAFMAIREKVGEGIPWQKWPKTYRTFSPAIIEGDPELRASAEQWRRAQFVFEREWRDLRAYANARGVEIVGDMPIYVSADSSDVWANPQIFELAEDGQPAVVSGCPPDAFSVEGQIWGNPVYNWDALKNGGYEWWLRRLERAFELYDVVRLDHFIGFCRYYCIPEGEKATKGSYRPGPGLDFFHAAYEKFGALPIIAEDLGAITPAVRALVAACGFPGMDIVQFADGNDPLSGYTPRPDKVAYTGTHDNQTLVGYAAARYAGLDAREVAETLMEKVAACDAPVVVLPLQDLALLDDDARMNIPGTSKGNWIWQAKSADLDAALERTKSLVKLHLAR